MANETRINLRHLLEDIRDGYARAVEEVIVTELTANALDSGASRIEFLVDPDDGSLTCIDNGRGMRRRELREYHNVAATTKERGRGIGFAGIGAKLSLLIASRVVTETHGPHGTAAATEWHLAGPTRAPWKFIPCGILRHGRGTAARVFVADRDSRLLEPGFISHTIGTHFFPLLHPAIVQEILRFVYRDGVDISVNGEAVTLQEYVHSPAKEFFRVYLGAGRRRPVGFGFVALTDARTESAEGPAGVAASAFGKVIKRGWEWLGVYPKSPARLFGAVEIPGLAELLTTNKTDFLNDAASLKKYYRYRKAVQDAILPVLSAMGEARAAPDAEAQGDVRHLSREIETALGEIVPDFPELGALVGARRQRIGLREASPYEPVPALAKEREAYLTGVAQAREAAVSVQTAAAEDEDRATVISPTIEVSPDTAGARVSSRKRPGLTIAFEAWPPNTSDGGMPLGRLAENTLFVNTAHPAWRHAKERGLEEYHIVLSAAWTLSGFLEEGRSPQDFVSRLLAIWGRRERGGPRLFEV